MPGNAKLLATLLAGALAPFFVATPGFAGPPDEVFAPTAQVTIPPIPIGSPPTPTVVPLASWDISFVDPTLGQFFLADRSHNAVVVVNTTNPPTFAQFIGQGLFTGVIAGSACIAMGATANDCSGPDGVLVTNHNELWVGDGINTLTGSTVKVFDLHHPANPPIVIRTNGKFRADEMCFDPDHQLVMVANNTQVDVNPVLGTNGPFATIISVKTHKIVKQIAFNGTKGAPKATNGAEQCQYSARTKRFYITIPGVEDPDNGHGVVAVINPADLDDKKVVEKVFDIPKLNCDVPQGMAVGPFNQILIGCNGSTSTTKSSVIIDERNGHILATVADESGPDEVWYNPGDGQYFLARSSAAAATQLLGVIDARTLQADQSVYTANKPNPPAASSHSVAVDPIHNQVFVAIGGNNSSTVCGALGGDNAKGCIAVYTTPKDDKCIAEGEPVRMANAGEDPVFMRGRCRDNDRHDHDDHRDDR